MRAQLVKEIFLLERIKYPTGMAAKVLATIRDRPELYKKLESH